ncbi:DUF4238 domain-containing protein [Kitasatospora sp. NPDC001660]
MTYLLELSTEAEKPVHRQHVISKVLLKRFATPQPKAAGLRVTRFDLHNPQRRHKHNSPAAFGWVDKYVPFASGSMERLWQDTENRLPAALAAVDNGSVLADPQAKDTLRDAIALHYTRSLRVRDIHHNSWQQTYTAHRTRLLTTDADRVRQAALAEYGLHLAGPDGLEYFVDLFLQPSTDLYESGALFRTSLENLFAKARQRLANASLHVVTAGAGEFLIGDSPAISVRNTRPGQRVLNIALGDASTVLLPLGPRHLVTLSREDRAFIASREQVDELNRLQIQAAERYVHHRPGEAITRFIRQTCAAVRPPALPTTAFATATTASRKKAG